MSLPVEILNIIAGFTDIKGFYGLLCSGKEVFGYYKNHPQDYKRIKESFLVEHAYRIRHGKEIYSTFPNGMRHGSFKRIINDNVVDECEYFHGKREGLRIHYEANDYYGNCIWGMYKNDKKDGEHICDWSSSGVCFVKIYREGLKLLETFWDEKGILTYQSIFDDGYTTNIEWYDNGNKKSEYTIFGGKKDGACREWDYQGNLEFEGFYVGDKLHGKRREWCNGVPQKEAEYKNGHIHGVYKVYYPTGKAHFRIVYNEGKRKGYISWYDNEKHSVRCVRKFDDGEAIYKKEWCEDGRVSSIIQGDEVIFSNLDY